MYRVPISPVFSPGVSKDNKALPACPGWARGHFIALEQPLLLVIVSVNDVPVFVNKKVGATQFVKWFIKSNSAIDACGNWEIDEGIEGDLTERLQQWLMLGIVSSMNSAFFWVRVFLHSTIMSQIPEGVQMFDNCSSSTLQVLPFSRLGVSPISSFSSPQSLLRRGSGAAHPVVGIREKWARARLSNELEKERLC